MSSTRHRALQTSLGIEEGARPAAPGVEPQEDWELSGRKFVFRRLFAELIGTFLLVIAACGAVVLDSASNGQVGRVASVVAPGLTVTAVILFMGKVAGAHLNPAVTLGFAARRDFPWIRVPGYIAAQLAGAVAACPLLRALFGTAGNLGATAPGAGLGDAGAMTIELVLTVGLVSTILGTASRAQNVGPLSALAVGAYIALAGSGQAPPRARR